MPGKLFSLSTTFSPFYSGTTFDSKFQEIGAPLKEALRDLGISHVSTNASMKIHGRSWEMACLMAALGHVGTYTGIVWGYDTGTAIFGPVPGVYLKEELSNDLKTVKNIPSIRVPSR